MTTDEETVNNFIALFRGRTDAYGSWTGGMVQANPPDWEYVEEPYFIDAHLHDGPFIGCYPVTDDNTTGWGCVDIDGKDHPSLSHSSTSTEPDWEAMWRIAADLQDVLAYKDVTSWIERTKNGIHVWVFAEERLPAATMRHALLVACEVAEYRPKEVNPKQTSVSAEKPLGNYVRLPYYGALSLPDGTNLPDRFVIDEDGRPMDVATFSRTAMGSRVPLETLEAMATLYVEPVKAESSIQLDTATEDLFVLLRPILPPVVAMMFEDGPKGDRSQTLVRCAAILRDDHWTPQATFTVLRALDRLVLGKFTGRPDEDQRLLGIMETVGL